MPSWEQPAPGSRIARPTGGEREETRGEPGSTKNTTEKTTLGGTDDEEAIS